MVDRYFPDVCTWWARTSSDGYGGTIFTAPVAVPCRWEDKRTLFVNRAGEEVMSAAIAYVARDMEIGDWLIHGNFVHVTNPTLVDGAYEIKQFAKTPDIRKLQTLRKAFM